MDSVDHVVRQVRALAGQRLPGWEVREDPEMGFDAYWLPRLGYGAITYSRSKAAETFRWNGAMLGYRTEVELFAFALAREFGRALQKQRLVRAGLWESFEQRAARLDVPYNLMLHSFPEALTPEEYLAYYRCVQGRFSARWPNRVARMLTGLSPADVVGEDLLAISG